MRALIIDDEKPVKTAISKLGHWKEFQLEEPSYAQNGLDALQTMREIHPQIIFVDINMPQMNGLEFLKQASSEFSDCQYIVVSGYDDFSYAQQAIHYGVCDYLLKPVEEDALNHAILTAIKKINPNFKPLDEDACSKDISADEVVEIIKEYIECHYHHNIKVTMFAEKYFYSVEYLNKLFRNKYDCTIYDYVVNIRMRRAKELLEDEDIKINDIATRLGYADSHYFSKAFRSYYEISPSQYRKNYFDNHEDI